MLSPLPGYLDRGGTIENKAVISACPQREKCMLRSGTNCNSLMTR
jgi:hypothetical protein